MILHHNILPNNIVAVTFTNKAANEMKTRLRSLIEPSKVESLVMGALHFIPSTSPLQYRRYIPLSLLKIHKVIREAYGSTYAKGLVHY